MLANTIFEDAVEKLFDVTKRFTSALEAAGISYRIIGGLAVFLHIDPIDPMAARLTKDVDIGFERQSLEAICAAVKPCGFTYRHVAGVDMFLDENQPSARSAVHVVFTGEKVRPEYAEAVPASEPVRCSREFFIAPVADLVRMKLTSFRLKDQVHIQDLDRAGLITPEIEESLSEVLSARLKQVRASE